MYLTDMFFFYFSLQRGIEKSARQMWIARSIRTISVVQPYLVIPNVARNVDQKRNFVLAESKEVRHVKLLISKILGYKNLSSEIFNSAHLH